MKENQKHSLRGVEQSFKKLQNIYWDLESD